MPYVANNTMIIQTAASKVRKFFVLSLMALGLLACEKQILHSDALKISNEAACRFYKEVGKDCTNIFPDSSESFDTPRKSGFVFYYLVQKTPLLELVIYVADDSTYEINKMDDR